MSTSTLTIGLDLGDRQHTVCVLNASGEIVAESSIPNSRESLEALSKEYPVATLAMETGTHSPWISRLLESKEPNQAPIQRLNDARFPITVRGSSWLSFSRK